MSIRTRFITLPTSIIIVIFVVILGLIQHIYVNVSVDVLSDEQQIIIESVSQTLDEYTIKHKEIMTHLATMNLITDTTNFDNTSDEYRGLSNMQSVDTRYHLKQTLDIYEEFAYLEIFKNTGHSVLLEPYEIQLGVELEDYQQGFAFRDWYKGAMENEDTYVSETYISASVKEPVIAISTPLYDTPDVISGILIGSVKLSSLNQKVNDLLYGETGITYIIDKNHNLVAYPNETFSSSESLYLVNTDITKYILTHPEATSTVKLFDQLTGEDVYVSYSRSSINDWIVITQISAAEFEKPFRDLIVMGVGLSSIIIVILIVLFIANTRQIIQPIEFLHTISLRISDDNLQIKDEEEIIFHKKKARKDEIGSLMHAYIEMVHKLQDSFAFQEKAKNDFAYLANHDALTMMPNRRMFRDKLQGVLENESIGAVILLDIDNFKIVNDTMGHVFGDKVLQNVATNLKSIQLSEVFSARFGGDEFILFFESANEAVVLESVEMVKQNLPNKLIIEGIPIEIRFSMGVAIFPTHSYQIDELLKYADLALYASKTRGKDQYQFFDALLEENVISKSAIKKAVQDALDNDGFYMVYQPQVNLKTGEIYCFEALIRFKNHAFSPAEFIPIAEENGQIIQIGRFVTRKVIEQQKIWKEKGYNTKRVAINYSATQLQDYDYLDFITQELQRADLPPSLIELEITENIFIDKSEYSTEFLQQIDFMGISIAIDDFGTGYSSIGYLLSLPISKIKLDRSISEKFLSKKQMKTIDSLIQLSHSLEKKVVAEGIEDISDAKILQSLQCDTIQGYCFSKPLEPEDVEKVFGKVYHEIL